jgi:hypothetical protein
MKKLALFLLVAVYLGMLLNARPGQSLFEMENDELVPAPFPNRVSITVNDEKRVIASNGVPSHEVGRFPGAGNPNSIREQDYHFELPIHPAMADQPISVETTHLFGIALNGVVFDPGTANYWHNDRSSIWHTEAIVEGRREFGLDLNNAHVQPNGAYHYHGIPIGLVKQLGGDGKMTQVGWAADGYPIYNEFGPQDAANPASATVKLRSSYRLKTGERPGGASGPGGAYDGSYTGDYEFVPGSGDLDEKNGRTGPTPEFPQGTYYYVLTEGFPYIPRLFKGTPDPSVQHRFPPGGGGPPPGGPGGPPDGPPPGPPPF